jgi:transcriptional regulator with XRE-family HTH domain
VAELDNFRKNLRIALETLGVTQMDLEEISGCSRVFINKILNNKSEPSITVAGRLARSLKLRCGDLCDLDQRALRAR